jgi:hypothetical protein
MIVAVPFAVLVLIAVTVTRAFGMVALMRPVAGPSGAAPR